MSGTVSLRKELNQMAEQHRTPVSVSFELTGRCNFDCKMCYVHTMDNCEALKYELTTEQWKQIFDEAYDCGMMTALFTGGECLLRPDFKDLYLYLFFKGIHLRVNTNGLLLSDEWIEFFKQYRPDSIQVTLYGTNDSEYDLITGKRVFSVVSENIDRLAASGIPYWVALTPCAQAKDFFKDIMTYAHGKQWPTRFSELLLPSREEIEREAITLTAEDYCDYFLYNAQLRGKKPVPIPEDLLPVPGCGGDEIALKHHCTAGKMRCAVNWKGEMYPCLTLFAVNSSVLENGYANAWKSVCEQVDQLRFPAKCASCAYKNICKPCYVLRCSEEDPNECNEMVCELIRLKVKCGLTKFKHLVPASDK